MYKIWKYFEKVKVIACNNHMQQTSRIAPVYTIKVKLLKKTSIFLSQVTKMLSGWNNVWQGYGT